MPQPKKPVLDLGPKNPMLQALEKARKDRLAKTPALTNTKPGAGRRDDSGPTSTITGGGGGGGGGGGMTSWQLTGDSGTTETVINTDLVRVLGGTGLSSVASNPDTVTVNLDNTAVTPGSYTYAGFTVDAQGRLTAAASGAAPMINFTLAGSSGSQTIADGNTLTIAAGTGVASTPVTATDTVTINTVWSKSSTNLSPATADDDILLHDGSTLQWGDGNPGTADVVLSRGAANRLDLASGDSFRIVSGNIQITGTGSSNSVDVSTTTDNAILASNGDASNPTIVTSNGTANGYDLYVSGQGNILFLQTTHTATPASGNTTLTADTSERLMAIDDLGNIRSLAGMVFRQTTVAAGDTISNTTTKTAFASTWSMPANTMKAGKRMRITLGGVYSTELITPASWELSLVWNDAGGDTEVTTSSTIIGNNGVTGAPWKFVIDIVCSATDTVRRVADGHYYDPTGGTIGNMMHLSGGNLTVDTDTATTVKAMVRMSATGASNSVTLEHFYVEVM